MDTDNSGSIDFQEFLLLAIPGFSSTRALAHPRKLLALKMSHAMYEDADGCGEMALKEVFAEIPDKCFRPAPVEEDHLGRALSVQPAPWNVSLELRLRFQRAERDRLGRTQSASQGNIVVPLKPQHDCWIDRDYPYDDKKMAHDQEGTGILFTAPPPPDPNRFPFSQSKLRCVKFPPSVAIVMEDNVRVMGFRIVSVSPQSLQITFDQKYGRYAAFPPPPNELTIIQSGPGTNLQILKVSISAFF